MIGLVGGLVLGTFLVILPMSDPYPTISQDSHLNCQVVNSTLTQCQQTGVTTIYQLCVKSYWWGQLCRTYRTVNS
jgi:hypothetical protein